MGDYKIWQIFISVSPAIAEGSSSDWCLESMAGCGTGLSTVLYWPKNNRLASFKWLKLEGPTTIVQFRRLVFCKQWIAWLSQTMPSASCQTYSDLSSLQKCPQLHARAASVYHNKGHSRLIFLTGVTTLRLVRRQVSRFSMSTASQMGLNSLNNFWNKQMNACCLDQREERRAWLQEHIRTRMTIATMVVKSPYVSRAQ